jgi:hypothetical protein
MRTSIKLEDGFNYSAYWGGELRPARKLLNGLECGEHCSVRKYHTLELIEVDGVSWVKEYQDDENYPGSYHLSYKSTCGNYKVSEYYAGSTADSGKVFLPYQCSTWRKHMQSTFGNYLRGQKETFKTFKKAAESVANHKKGELL